MAHPLRAYVALIDDLRVAGFACHPIRDYFTGDRFGDAAHTNQTSPESRIVYLRHDVDRLPRRAVAMAEAEAGLGVRSTYYFRCDQRMRFPETAMRHIADLGHETGFHYESLSRCKGDNKGALALFERELAACRAVVEVETVAPHGAPPSAASNMDFSARICPGRFALLGDATGIDFTDILYVTDTGGTFGSPHNLRDRTQGPMLTAPVNPRRLPEHLTGHRRIVLSCHPERWPAGTLVLAEASARDSATNLAKWLLQHLRAPDAGSRAR